jgi:hypothetical protein
MKKQNSNKEENKGKVIKASIILEIMGKPPEYLLTTLEKIIKDISEEKGVEVTGKKINELILMKDSKEFYTTFAEVDLEVENILYLTIIMFKYMPAHVEVIEPEVVALTNNGWTDILSEITRRLHGYDEISRILQLQNSKMQKKLRELLAEKKENPSDITAPPIELSNELPPEKEEKKTEPKKQNKEKKKK